MLSRLLWIVLIFLAISDQGCAGNAFAQTEWQRGITIVPRWDTDFSSDTFRQSVLQARAANANQITLQIIHWQAHLEDSEILAGGNTPTDQSLIEAVQFIHSQGMQASFKLQVLVANLRWSAEINPTDRDAWFANYKRILLHYSELAQRIGVEQMVMGSELTTVTSHTINPDNTRRWRDLIAGVRGVFNGKLTYSANWGPGSFSNEKGQIMFWDELDYLGVSGYYEMRGDSSVKNMLKHWKKWEEKDLRPFQKRWNKPVLFTEVGYKSVRNAHHEPWNWQNWGSYDPQLQANAYEALLKFWSERPYSAGVLLWDWNSDPEAGGEGDLDYTPKNKQAYGVLTHWFGKIGSQSESASGSWSRSHPSSTSTMGQRKLSSAAE